ncbi:MAG: hypothetical protein ACLFT2_03915 [Candidatus Brocadiia bacterium]
MMSGDNTQHSTSPDATSRERPPFKKRGDKKAAAPRTLGDELEERGHLPLRKAICLFRDVVEAVSRFHGHGAAYGAINPDAIIIRENKTLVRRLRKSDRVDLEDRQSFRAPELEEAERPDTLSDIYSLGVLFHWMLLGRVPRRGQADRKLPARLRRIIDKAIAPDPRQRTRTIDSMLDQLDQLDPQELEEMEREIELALNATGFDPRLIWHRHPLAALITLALISAALAAGAWIHQRHEARREQQAAERQEKREKKARKRALRENAVRGRNLYEEGRYHDALETFRYVVQQDIDEDLREEALAYIARCHRELEDRGAEYTAWLRLLREYPETDHAGEANKRIARIASLTLKEYGDFVNVATGRDIMIDGLRNDWGGIEPVITDEKGDNAEGGPESDLVALYIAVKGDRMFVRFETAEPPRKGDQYGVAFDLNAVAYGDSSENWDYQIGVQKGTPPWIWDLRGEKEYETTRSSPLHGVDFAQKECVEFSFPLSAIDEPCNVSVRAFINYQNQDSPTDMTPRKVLVEWCEAPAEGGETTDDNENASSGKED